MHQNPTIHVSHGRRRSASFEASGWALAHRVISSGLSAAVEVRSAAGLGGLTPCRSPELGRNGKSVESAAACLSSVPKLFAANAGTAEADASRLAVTDVAFTGTTSHVTTAAATMNPIPATSRPYRRTDEFRRSTRAAAIEMIAINANCHRECTSTQPRCSTTCDSEELKSKNAILRSAFRNCVRKHIRTNTSSFQGSSPGTRCPEAPASAVDLGGRSLRGSVFRGWSLGTSTHHGGA